MNKNIVSLAICVTGMSLFVLAAMAANGRFDVAPPSVVVLQEKGATGGIRNDSVASPEEIALASTPEVIEMEEMVITPMGTEPAVRPVQKRVRVSLARRRAARPVANPFDGLTFATEEALNYRPFSGTGHSVRSTRVRSNLDTLGKPGRNVARDINSFNINQ